MQEFTVIVSGLPRSGTSMMMRVLEAGGMEVAVDNVRRADEDNPRGYYEFEQVKNIRQDKSWFNGLQGRAVKMVSMLLYDLPADKRYKIVFMKRKPVFGLFVASRSMICEAAANLLLHCPFFIQADANAYRTISLMLTLPHCLNFSECFSFKIGEFEILEHDIDQFVQGNIRLVVIDARLVACPALPGVRRRG